ncbi:MAG: BON domain-containing protein [Vicinamibacterales bacterium]
MRATRAITAMTGVVVLAAAIACGDRDEPRTEEAARDTGRTASDAARDAGNAVADGARAASDAVGNAGRAADAAVETMDVKAALMRDSGVDAGDIDVDTNHETRTVVLKGRVPTAAQKAAAERIAVQQARGYRVQNDLTVGQ